MLRLLSEQGLLTFLAAGFFLHEAAIRIAPTLSHHGTIRIEPSAYIADGELDSFLDVLRRFCELVRQANVPRLWKFAMKDGPWLELVRDEANPQYAVQDEHKEPATLVTVGFLVHFRTGADLRLFDRGFGRYSEEACERYFEKARHVIDPFVIGRRRIRSAVDARAVDLVAIGLPFTAEHASTAMAQAAVEPLVELVRRGMLVARSNGARIVGCGGYTSILTDNCRAIASEDLSVTSGNSLTVAAALEALFAAAVQRKLEHRVLGVVGATGNIGAMLAESASAEVDRIVLLGRPGAVSRLERLASRLGRPTTVSTDLADLSTCNLIVCASNSPRPIVHAEHLGTGPVVVCDLAVPCDVDLGGLRPDVHLFRGGLLRLPRNQQLGFPGIDLESGSVYACMAEAVVLGLSQMVEGSFSYGPLQADKITLIRSLAKHHGFQVEADVVVAP